MISRNALTTTVAACSLLLSSAASAQRVDPSPTTPDIRALDSTLSAAVAQSGIIGLSTAVIVDGRIVWTRSYGMADRERREPLTTQTVMNLGSIAKTTIGVSMMRLVSEKKLDLDADINRYLPFRVVNPHLPQARITLRHLATHTSSITDRRDYYETMYRPVGEARPTLEAQLRSYLVAGGANYRAENYLSVAPGASRDYSNLGATLAAFIVERVAGESFDAHTRRVIFDPLGMRTARWRWPADGAVAHSQLYVQDSTGTSRHTPYDLVSYPDGGLQMSVEDLAVYFAMLLSGGKYRDTRIIGRAALTEMQRLQWTAANKPADFDLKDGNSGLFWRTKFSGRRVGHGGNDPGVSAEMLTDAVGRVGIIMISNTSPYRAANRHVVTVIDALTAFGERVAAASPARGAPSR
jgi:CubicO group peptidase (beta-lactamase class C family)